MIVYLLTGALTLALMRKLLGFTNTPLVVWSILGWPVVLGALVFGC